MFLYVVLYSSLFIIASDEQKSPIQDDEASPNPSASQPSQAEKNTPSEVEPMDTEGNMCVYIRR